MYIQTPFEETRIEVLHALIRDHPLGTFVAMTQDGLEANHIPFEICDGPHAFGTLRAHVARANPIWNSTLPALDTMLVFQGPNAYISPSWYVNGKKSGKLAPSWNYAVVHAYGRLRVIEDGDWLREHLGQLVARHEAGQPTPWSMAEQPPEFTDNMVRAIVGIEIEITRLVGKWFVSQHRTPADRVSLAANLRLQHSDSATAVAELISRVDAVS